VIDDSALSRKTLEMMLVASGYTVVLANNGEQGLAMISQTLPDLLLIDVVMPELNGWETCARLRSVAVGETIPVIVITSKNTPQDMLQAFEVGANEFISKPIDETELIATIDRLLKQGEGSSAAGKNA
jgi:PleD family two-component response regulator